MASQELAEAAILEEYLPPLLPSSDVDRILHEVISANEIKLENQTLAHELLPLGIRVNGITPGLFASAMSAPGTADAGGISHFPPDAQFPFETPVARPGPHRQGTYKDIGGVVLFLVANWFVDGEVVLLDGGVSALTCMMYTGADAFVR